MLMKKMYVLVLLAIGFAGMCMAQDDVVTAVTINNWDGSPKSPDEPLYIGVGEMRILNLTLEPENANDTTFHLGMVMEEGDEENSPIAFWGLEIGANRAATRTLNIWNNDWTERLATTQIVAYDTEGVVGEDSTMRWNIWWDEEAGGSVLILSQGSDEPGVLEDRADGVTYPWDELSESITRLEIAGDFRYIGARIFEELYNLKHIRFVGGSVESIHAETFSRGIRPWKFAFGNPQDGAIIPPQIVFGEYNEPKVIEFWQEMFADSTVLYVPDSAFEYQGRPVHAIDLYRGDAIWGSVFNRIDDHTVAQEALAEDAVLFKWLPQENASSYWLIIRKTDCVDCVASIEIPATGERGLVDWQAVEDMMHMNGGPRRVIREDDHGGMTLTISLQAGSGMTHTSDIEVAVSGLKDDEDYTFERGVAVFGAEEPSLNKAGALSAPATPIDNVYVTYEGAMKIYDILGRTAGDSLEELPDGIYILSNGTLRTKVLLRR